MTETGQGSNPKNAQESLDFLNFLQQKSMNSFGENEDPSKPKNTLDSVDFVNFLQQKSMKTNDSLTGLLGPSAKNLFRSKDSFVGSFLSKDSINMQPPAENLNIPTAFMAAPSTPVARDGKFTVQKSQDWMKYHTLGDYVDMPYSTSMFSSGSSQPVATAPIDVPASFSTSAKQNTAAATGTKTKRKRKRAPRKKIIPANKQYKNYTDDDVLMGRGGKSNHHKGNIRYRAEIERLQAQYKMTDDKDEKTSISEQLVAFVKSFGGNFLENDGQGWYIIEDVVARRKASQALREDKDPEKRRAKRQRFLAKRARQEEEKRRKGIQNGD
jgi:hypothetical protein